MLALITFFPNVESALIRYEMSVSTWRPPEINVQLWKHHMPCRARFCWVHRRTERFCLDTGQRIMLWQHVYRITFTEN